MTWGFAHLVVALACAVVLVAAAWLAQRRWEMPLVATVSALLVTCVVAWVVAGCRLACMTEGTRRFQSRAVSSWELTTKSDCTVTSTGYRCRARARAADGLTADVWLSVAEPLRMGSVLTCVGRFSPLSDDDYGRSSRLQGICGSVRVVRVRTLDEVGGPYGWLLDVRQAVIEALEPQRSPTRALLAACVCGYRMPLDAWDLADLFSTCGIAHLVAVSGTHLALVAALLSQLLETLELRPPARLGLLTVVTGAFVVFCGAPPSALRAWAMSLVASAAQLTGRRGHALSSVCVVGLVMAMADPALCGQLGFLLSVTSVAGLCLFSAHAYYALRMLVPDPRLPRALRSLRRPVGRLLDGVRSLLAATMVCQLVTIPLTLDVFGKLSLVAPLTNVLAGAPLTLLMGLGLVAATLSWMPPLRSLTCLLAEFVGAPTLLLLERLARLPFATVSAEMFGGHAVVLCGLLVVVWLAWWPPVRRRVVLRAIAVATAGMLAVLALWRFGAPARIVVLDVGQGDAILVQDGGAAVLVDAGPDDSVVDALARFHVLHLDMVVVTHLHDDHYGGVLELAGSVPCDQVMVANGVADHVDGELAQACRDLCDRPPGELACGDVLQVGGFELQMIWPWTEVDGSENAHSIELACAYARQGSSLTALLTGDAEYLETGACVTAGLVEKIDLLKVGHHGSEVSLDEHAASVLSPEIAVASAGEGNSYGHPRPECVELLERVGATFLCTKDVGDVEVRPGVEGPLVRCSRERGPCAPEAPLL